MVYNIYEILIMTAVISFLGFLLENTWLACTKGFVDNRNMGLPFLLGYGVLVTGMYGLMGTPAEMVICGIFRIKLTERAKLVLYFCLSFLIVSIGEITLGTLVERHTGICYWDYNWIPMHITQYTSVPTSMGFAGIITLFMDKAFVPIMTAIQSIEPDDMRSGGIVLTSLMVLDMLVSFKHMYTTKRLNVRWRYEIKARKLITVKSGR